MFPPHDKPEAIPATESTSKQNNLLIESSLHDFNSKLNTKLNTKMSCNTTLSIESSCTTQCLIVCEAEPDINGTQESVDNFYDSQTDTEIFVQSGLEVSESSCNQTEQGMQSLSIPMWKSPIEQEDISPPPPPPPNPKPKKVLRRKLTPSEAPKRSSLTGLESFRTRVNSWSVQEEDEDDS